MAISTYNCLQLTPPSQNSTPSILKPKPKPNQLIWDLKERSWKRQMATGLACVLIGLEMGNFVISQDEALAAGDVMQLVGTESSRSSSSSSKVGKWSDKRSCPPWRQNSLENIVPEDLPRPSTHRSFEAIGYAHDSFAPRITIKVVQKYRSKCFTM